MYYVILVLYCRWKTHEKCHEPDYAAIQSDVSNAPDVFHHICYVLYTFSQCNAMIDPDPYIDQCIHDLVLCDYNTVVSFWSKLANSQLHNTNMLYFRQIAIVGWLKLTLRLVYVTESLY